MEDEKNIILPPVGVHTNRGRPDYLEDLPGAEDSWDKVCSPPVSSPAEPNYMKHHVKDFEKEHLFFATSTVFRGTPVFHKKVYADIVLESLRFITEHKWVDIYSFVLMPDHLHLIFKVLEENSTEKVNENFH
jgi:hypothetical protein